MWPLSKFGTRWATPPHAKLFKYCAGQTLCVCASVCPFSSLVNCKLSRPKCPNQKALCGKQNKSRFFFFSPFFKNVFLLWPFSKTERQHIGNAIRGNAALPTAVGEVGALRQVTSRFKVDNWFLWLSLSACRIFLLSLYSARSFFMILTYSFWKQKKWNHEQVFSQHKCSCAIKTTLRVRFFYWRDRINLRLVLDFIK